MSLDSLLMPFSEEDDQRENRYMKESDGQKKKDDDDFQFYIRKRIEYFNVGQLMQHPGNEHLIHDLHRLHVELLNLEKNDKVVRSYEKKFHKMQDLIDNERIDREKAKLFVLCFHPKRLIPSVVLNGYQSRQTLQLKK